MKENRNNSEKDEEHEKVIRMEMIIMTKKRER